MTTRANAYLFRRYLWLWDTIERLGPITYGEINRLWMKSILGDGSPLPHKTFENHRLAVEELFGREIICDRRDNSYYIDKTADDSTSNTVREMLESLLLAQALGRCPQLRDKVEFEKTEGGAKFITPILLCLKDNLTARLTYCHSYKPDDIDRDILIFPTGLKMFKRRWYLIAQRDGKSHTYALDRIISLQPGDRSPVRQAVSVSELFKDNFGIVREEGMVPEEIILKAEPVHAKFLKALPLHPSQKVIKEESGTVWFSMRLMPTYDFVTELLSFGPDTEVIAPAHLRREIAEMYQQATKLYSK